MPALNASRADVSTLVKDSVSQSGMGFRRNRGRSALVIVEMALALVLLAGAGLLIRTFVAMRTVNRGFDEQNVLTLEMSLGGSQFEKTAQVAQLVRNAERRIQNIPRRVRRSPPPVRFRWSRVWTCRSPSTAATRGWWGDIMAPPRGAAFRRATSMPFVSACCVAACSRTTMTSKPPACC